jgi:hypothetical protein
MKRKKKQGGYRKTEFGDLVKADPAQAAALLRDAWAREGGSKKAAKSLDISQRSFFRCVLRLEAVGFNIDRPSETTNDRIDPVI